MEQKDWILLLFPIIFNGVISIIFAKSIDVKIKRKEKKEDAHTKIVNLFFEELIELNKVMIETNAVIQFEKIADSTKVIELIKNNILPQWIKVIVLYDTYKFALEEFSAYYEKMEQSWDSMTKSTRTDEGKQLQGFKEATVQMITEIVKKY